MQHRQLTTQEMEQLTGGFALTEPIAVFGAFEGEQLIAVYGLVNSGYDAPEVCLHILHKQPALKTFREIKKGLRLLNDLGYGNLYAEAGQKYLNKIGFTMVNKLLGFSAPKVESAAPAQLEEDKKTAKKSRINQFLTEGQVSGAELSAGQTGGRSNIFNN